MITSSFSDKVGSTGIKEGVGGLSGHWMVVWNFVRRNFTQTISWHSDHIRGCSNHPLQKRFLQTQPWIRVLSQMKDF